MTHYEIRDDIPAPITGKNTGCYNFAAMKVGSSFSVPFKERHKMTNAAYYYKKTHPDDFVYIVRTLLESGEKIARIWRIAVEAKRRHRHG